MSEIRTKDKSESLFSPLVVTYVFCFLWGLCSFSQISLHAIQQLCSHVQETRALTLYLLEKFCGQAVVNQA
jgi:hypothetical protein